MRGSLVGLAGLLMVTGCGSSDLVVSSDPVPEPYDGRMHIPVDHRDRASLLAGSGAAGQALECDTAIYAGGSGDHDSGLTSAQDGAASTLEDFLSEEFFLQMPSEGYRVEREDDGRVLLSYDVDEATKVAVIVSGHITDFEGEEGWGVETWAQCDPSELPAAVTEELGIAVWTDASGERVPVTTVSSSPGPEHCDWQDITFLNLGTGERRTQYLRDTTGELGRLLTTTYDASAILPDGAEDTGYEHDGRRLWLHPAGTAAYLVDTTDPDDVERWPAATEPIACA